MNPLLLTAVVLLVIVGLPYLGFIALYAWVRPAGSPAQKTSVEPTVSVVLPTYNEDRIIQGKLERICAWDYPHDKLEVVVVDSSDDDTPELIRDFFDERTAPTLTLIKEEERRGLAPALNDAYAAAGHEVVVKTDCDSKVAEDALREAVANLADPEVGAVTGRNAEVLGGSAVEAEYRGVQAHVQVLESHLDSTFIFHGPFSAFENETILPIDDASLADDTELALRIRRTGTRVIFDPAIRYREAAHSGFRKRRSQKDRRGLGLIRLLIQHRDMLGGYGLYGRMVLPFNWWFMIVSPWILMGSLLLGTWGALSAWGVAGFLFPLLVVMFVGVGSQDRLGPLQPVYAVFDTQISLFRASIELVRGDYDNTWDVDSELREAYE